MPDSDFVLAGRYAFVRDLARGDSSATWLAEDRETGQAVVVKSLAIAEVERLQDWQLFEREARVLAQLDHPAIPRFIEYFDGEKSNDDRIHLIQEYVRGDNCRERSDRGARPTEREVVSIGIRLCGVLEYLHGKAPPIIHRDIKPSNVVIDEVGGVHLVDFGAVSEKVVLGNERRTVTVVGTFGYMPFEQFSGKPVPASDLYALGATLLFLLSHRDPDEFRVAGGEVHFDDVRMHADLRIILARCLRARVEDRYESAALLRRDLERRFRDEPLRPPRFTRGRVAGMVALVALIGIVMLAGRERPPQPVTRDGPTATVPQPTTAPPPRRPMDPDRLLSLRLLHGGQPIGSGPVEILVTDQSSGMQTRPPVAVSDGGFGVSVGGAAYLHVFIPSESERMKPGSLVSERVLVAGDLEGSLDVEMVEVMHLTLPHDSADDSEYNVGAACAGVHAYGQTPTFAWEAIPDAHYEYEIGSYDCASGVVTQRMGPFLTTGRVVRPTLEPNPEGTAYLIAISAHRDGHRVAEVQVRDTSGSGRPYVFRVLPENGGLLGYVTHAGNQLDLREYRPRFWFRDEEEGTVIEPDVLVNPDIARGGFAIYGLPPKVGMQISFNLNEANAGGYPGDLRGFKVIEPDKVVGRLDFRVLGVVHLTWPVDNSVPVAGWHEGCATKPAFPGDVPIRWQPVAAADGYRVRIVRTACEGRLFETVVDKVQGETELAVNLAPTGGAYNYRLTVLALRRGEAIAQLLTHGERGGLAWDYRFRTF